MRPPAPDQALAPALLSEAADWLITLRYSQASAPELVAFEQWRQKSPAHARAWARVESMLGTFQQVPPEVCKQAMLTRPSRRQGLGMLALLAVPAGWLLWQEAPSHRLATAVGEQRTITLDDGSRVVLNTASVMSIRFNARERQLVLLQGEIMVTTHADPIANPRPFVVQTDHGTVQALGTRFSVRVMADQTRVAIYQHAVKVSPRRGSARILNAGERADFGPRGISASAVAPSSDALWEQGVLLAKNMRLSDVLAELSRYDTVPMRCDEAVADLRVSGALSLQDTRAALELLALSLPVRVQRHAGTVQVVAR